MNTTYEYVMEGDSYPDDAIAFESLFSSKHPQYIADEAGVTYYEDDPDTDAFPLELEIFHQGKSLGQFEVHIDFEPTFNSVRVP